MTTECGHSYVKCRSAPMGGCGLQCPPKSKLKKHWFCRRDVTDIIHDLNLPFSSHQLMKSAYFLEIRILKSGIK